MYNLMISGSRSIGRPIQTDPQGRRLNDGEILAIKVYRQIRVGEYIEHALGQWGLEIKNLLLLTGHAEGVDRFAELWATKKGVPARLFIPDWRTKGRAAGIIRNKEMLNQASMVVAIWDGNSAGTRFVIHTARERSLPLCQVDWTSGRVTIDGPKPKEVQSD